MALATATNPAESVASRTARLREKHDAREMALLLKSCQYDLATLQANYNLLLARLDAVSALATTLAGGTVTGTVFATWFPATQKTTYGADVVATQANLLTTTTFQP